MSVGERKGEPNPTKTMRRRYIALFREAFVVTELPRLFPGDVFARPTSSTILLYIPLNFLKRRMNCFDNFLHTLKLPDIVCNEACAFRHAAQILVKIRAAAAPGLPCICMKLQGGNCA